MSGRWFLFGMALICACGLYAAPHRAKLLHYGWDMTNAFELAKNHRQMEESMPFDGVMFPLTGGGASTLYIWDGNPWPDNVFDDALASLKSCKFTRFTDNYVMTWISPGPVEWMDDNAWRVIASKFRIVARVAREAGLKGICFDPEPYQQFNWAYKPVGGRSFKAMQAVARRRGREIMAEMAAEYPQMTFMAFWLLSTYRCRTGQPDPIFGLYSAFIDGLWDAVPPEMTIVDGCEGGYSLNTQSGTLRQVQSIRKEHSYCVSPENRAKYRRQISAGFGFYLDPYVYHVPGWIEHDGTQLATLFHNMNYLLSSADEYVWFYSEKHRMFAPEGQSIPWETKLPGLDLALRMARHPENYIAEAMKKGGEGMIPNHWPNPDFDASAESALKKPHRSDWRLLQGLPGYEAWFEGDNPPVAIADGKLEINGGIFVIAPIAVTGGNVFYLTVPFWGAEGVDLCGYVGFLNAQGVWIEQDNAMTEARTPDGMRRLELLLGPAPDAAAQMVVVLRRVDLAKDAGPLTMGRPGAYRLDDLLPPLAKE